MNSTIIKKIDYFAKNSPWNSNKRIDNRLFRKNLAKSFSRKSQFSRLTDEPRFKDRKQNRRRSAAENSAENKRRETGPVRGQETRRSVHESVDANAAQATALVPDHTHEGAKKTSGQETAHKQAVDFILSF